MSYWNQWGCVLLALWSLSLPAQELEFSWAERSAGSGDAWVEATDTDSQGNIMVAGYFSETEAFYDQNIPVYLFGQGAYDGFLISFDLHGTYRWHLGVQGTGDIRIRDMIVDANDDILISGIFQGTADFATDRPDGDITATGVFDAFLAKYSNAGALLWVRAFHAIEGSSTAFAMDETIDGDILIAGRFMGQVDMDPGIGMDVRESIGGTDIFLSRLSSDGQSRWTKTMGGGQMDEATNVVAAPDGDILISGHFAQWADFAPGTDIQGVVSQGGQDIFLARYDEQGAFLSVSGFGGSGTDKVHDMTIDALGQTILCGQFMDEVEFVQGVSTVSNGAEDGYILCADASGQSRWVRTFGDSWTDRAQSIISLEDGRLFCAGTFWGTVDMDPGLGTVLMQSQDVMDLFIIELDSEGELAQTRVMPGSSTQYYPHLSLGLQGDISLAATFSGDCDMDPGDGTDVQLAYGYDMMLISLEQVGPVLSLDDRFGPTAAVTVFPNPNDGRFRLISESDLVMVDLIDMRGRLMESVLPLYDNEVSLTGSYSPGSYLLRIHHEDGSITAERIVLR